MATDLGTVVWPPSGSGGGGGGNASVGLTGSPAPTSATEIAGVNGSGNLQAATITADGGILVDIGATPTISENVAQFGGNPVVTGTGASGLGIPRMTVSNDSSITANAGSGTFDTSDATTHTELTTINTTLGAPMQNTGGTVTVTQGTAANLNATVIGTVTANLGTIAGVSTAANQTTLGSQTTKINDGTNTAAVKAASTAAVATDPSLVVALSPNSPIPTGANTIGAISNTSFQATQATAANLNATVVGTTAAGSGAATGLVTIQGNASGTPIPISGSITATNLSIGATGSPVPADATMIGGTDGTNLRAVKVSATGVVSVDGSAVTQPVSGTVTANAGTGSFTVAQTTAANLNATVVGTVTANIGTTNGLALDSSVQELNVALEELTQSQGSTTAGQVGPLTLTATTTAAPTYSTTTSNPLSTTTAGALRVDGSGVTQPVSGTVTANAGTGSFTVAQATAANLNATITPAGGAVFSTAPAGTASANAPIQNTYSSTNITTAAYTQLVASTSNTINTIHIFDSSGQAMIFATGAGGSEVIKLYVPPGGDTYTLNVPSGTRIAYKALTANATSGYLLMSFLE